jgi:hypothetical protein
MFDETWYISLIVNFQHCCLYSENNVLYAVTIPSPFFRTPFPLRSKGPAFFNLCPFNSVLKASLQRCWGYLRIINLGTLKECWTFTIHFFWIYKRCSRNEVLLYNVNTHAQTLLLHEQRFECVSQESIENNVNNLNP